MWAIMKKAVSVPASVTSLVVLSKLVGREGARVKRAVRSRPSALMRPGPALLYPDPRLPAAMPPLGALTGIWAPGPLLRTSGPPPLLPL